MRGGSCKAGGVQGGAEFWLALYIYAPNAVSSKKLKFYCVTNPEAYIGTLHLVILYARPAGGFIRIPKKAWAKRTEIS